jgi:hypothetical protein
VADVNKDGALDLAVHPRLATGPRVFLGNGQGKWRDSSSGLAMTKSCGGGLQLSDVNNDGMIDVAVADHCEGVFVFLGDANGQWRKVKESLIPEFNTSAKAKRRDPEGFKGAEAIGLGDVNGDRLIDIVASSSDQGGLTVYLGDGSGSNWREVKRPGLPNGEESDPLDVYHGGWAFDLQLIDMNGDGHLDVVASYYTGPRVWHGDGTGHFQDRSSGLLKTTVGGIYGRIAVGDINRDGRPDIAIANNVNGAEAYLRNADGSWRGPIDMMPELNGGAQAVALGDIDGDGHLDVVVGGALSSEPNLEMVPHGVFVRWGDSTGNFGAARATNLPSVGLEVIWGIALADIDRDGRLDIVVSMGGDTGKIPDTPITRTAGRPAQKSLGLPLVQVWLNEGIGAR